MAGFYLLGSLSQRTSMLSTEVSNGGNAKAGDGGHSLIVHGQPQLMLRAGCEC